MSRGAFPENVKCTFCQSYVNEADAVWEDSQPYHEACNRRKIRKEIAAAEKKMRRGTLSLIEARELAELKELDKKNSIELLSQPLSSKMFDKDVPRFHGNTPLGLWAATKPRSPLLKAAEERIKLAESANYISAKEIKLLDEKYNDNGNYNPLLSDKNLLKLIKEDKNNGGKIKDINMP